MFSFFLQGRGGKQTCHSQRDNLPPKARRSYVCQQHRAVANNGGNSTVKPRAEPAAILCALESCERVVGRGGGWCSNEHYVASCELEEPPVSPRTCAATGCAKIARPWGVHGVYCSADCAPARAVEKTQLCPGCRAVQCSRSWTGWYCSKACADAHCPSRCAVPSCGAPSGVGGRYCNSHARASAR